MSATGKDAPVHVHRRGQRALTAPGQLFEMEELDIRGVPHPDLEERAARRSAPSSTCRSATATPPSSSTRTSARPSPSTTASPAPWRTGCVDTFGIAQGDRVAIIMRNLPEWVMAFWGATLAGAIVVPLNAWWSGEELRYGLEDSGSKVAFVDTERAERIRPFLGGLPYLGAVIVADEHRSEPEAPLAVYEPPGGAPRCPNGRSPSRWAPWTRPPRRPTSPSTRRTTPPSSTRRAPPADPRAPSARTAT